MSELFWLLAIFVLLNVLDGYTTWLGLYKLPPELRAREANVFFKSVETRFWPAMIPKALIVLFGVWLFTRTASVFGLKVIDLVFAVVVLNNAYVYLSRRITGTKHKNILNLTEELLQKWHVPEKLAKNLSFYLLLAVLITMSVYIIGTTS